MIDSDKTADLNFQKAMATKNNNISVTTVGITAIVTVLVPLLLGAMNGAEKISVGVASLLIASFVVALLLNYTYSFFKYMEYRSNYIRFYSFPFADEYSLNNVVEPEQFEEGDLVYIVRLVHEETLFNMDEIISELRNYYMNDRKLDIEW